MMKQPTDGRLDPKKSYRNFRWFYSVRRNGLSLEDIARVCGVALTTVERWNRRHRINHFLKMQRYSWEYYRWRNAVFARDDYRCVRCNKKRNLHAHHIKSWDKHPKLRFRISNGETLCEGCHMNIHPWMRMLYESRIRNERQ